MAYPAHEELCDRLKTYLGNPGDSSGNKKLTQYLRDLEKRIGEVEARLQITKVPDPPPKPPDLGP